MKELKIGGVAHSITAFDIKASQPYRYIHIYTEETNSLVMAEIYVYTKTQDTIENTVETENILLEKECVSQSGNGEADKINDGDETTEWILENMGDFAIFRLNGSYNIRSMELITEALPDDLEIWGGVSNNFAQDEERIKLSDGENLIFDVEATNITEFITIRPSSTATLPISIKELAIYVEKGVRLVNISEDVEASEAGLTDGILNR